MNYRARSRTILAFVLSLAFGCRLRAAPIHDAAQAGDVGRIRALLAADPTLLDAKENKSATPLWFAAGKGRLEVVRLLLEKGANSNIRAGGWRVTPLAIAMNNGHTEVALLLRKAGAK